MNPPSLGRVPALDGLRGLAILLVLCGHGVPGDTNVPAERALQLVLLTGWVGVELFFVLSGFLITGILLEVRDSPQRARNFYMRRALRIWPLYLAALVALLVIFPRIGFYSPAQAAWYAAHQDWYWFHLANIGHAVAGNPPFDWTTHLWSLSVEEQFYLLWPFIVWRLSPRSLRRACIALVGVAIAARVATAGGALSPYFNTLTRVDGLAMGSWLAAARDGDWSSVAAGVDRLGAGAMLLLAACWAMVPSLLPKDDPRLVPFTETLLAVAFAALLMRALDGRSRLAWSLSQPWLRSFGQYSYGIYVIHLPLRGVLEREGLTPGLFTSTIGLAVPGRLAYLAVLVGLSYSLAWISWHVWEQPWLQLKSNFPRSPVETRPA